MVNGPTTPIPVKAKPSSTDPVIPPVTMGESHRDVQANPDQTLYVTITVQLRNYTRHVMDCCHNNHIITILTAFINPGII